MKATMKKTRRSREAWETLVHKAQASTLSMRQFAREEGINYQSLMRWKTIVEQHYEHDAEFLELPRTALEGIKKNHIGITITMGNELTIVFEGSSGVTMERALIAVLGAVSA